MSSPFSNSTKIYAASVTSRVLENYDDPLPGIVAGAVVTNQNIATQITDYLSGGLFFKTEKYFKYGRDEYVRGLPEGMVMDETINYAELSRVIELEVSSRIILIYAKINTNSSSNTHEVFQHMQDAYDRNPETGYINILPPDASVPPLYRPGFIFDHFTYNATTNVATIIYSYGTEDDYRTHTEYVILNDPLWYSYQVMYQKINSAGESVGTVRYWSYRKGTGTYPVLEASPATDTERSPNYYPIIPFYEDKTQIGDIANKGTPLYDTSKKMFEKLGMNYKKVVKGMAEGTGESIGKDKGLYAYMVLSAEVTAGIPKYADAGMTDSEKLTLMTDSQATLHYLVDYLTLISLSSKYDENDFNTWKNQPVKLSPPNYNTIAITDDSFKYKFMYAYISVSTHPGSIGKIGWCTNAFVEDPYTYTDGTHAGDEQSYTISVFTGDYIKLRKQITEDSYLEIKVVGMYQVFTVFRDVDAVTLLAKAFIENPLLINIPLYRDVVLKQPDKYRNRLMHAALVFVFNSYLKQEIAWYQDGFWAFVITVVGIVFAIPTGGQSIQWAAVFTAAFLTAAARALLYALLRYLIFREVVKLIAKEFGVEAAFIVSLLMIAYGKFGQNTGAAPGLPYAQTMMLIGINMWSSTNELVQQNAKDIMKDYARTLDEMDKLNTELERAEKLLQSHSDIDPWLFVNPMPNLIFGESPDAFLSVRQEKNPGVVVLQGPTYYADLMLTLPTTNDSLNTSLEGAHYGR